MGRGFTQYSFPDSDAEDVWALYSAFLNYELADGSLLHVRQAESWCPECDCILMAERVPTLAELEAELAMLKNPTDEERDKINFVGGPIAERIAEQERRIVWRHNRQSAAKCLQCGCVDVVQLPQEDEFRHPKTGERMVKSGWGFASTGMWDAVFSPEGDLIRNVIGRA